MPKISICHRHTQGVQSVEEVIRKHEHPVAHRYGLKTRWVAHTLHVERAGMKAQIDIDEQQLEVQIDVPWMFRALLPQIESKVRDKLAYYFC